MNFQNLIPKLLILTIFNARWTNSEKLYGTCNGSFSCGSITGFQYPFRLRQDLPECGYPGFELNCDQQNLSTINIMNITYQVLGINPTAQIMKLIREDMVDSTCPHDLVNTTIDHELFDYTSNYTNASLLFGCPNSFNLLGTVESLSCSNYENSSVYLVPGVFVPGVCKTSVIIPFRVELMGSTGMVQVLREGFEVRWKVEPGPCTECIRSGGQCVYDIGKHLTTCACPESSLLSNSCQEGTSRGPSGALQNFKRKWKLVAGVTCGACVMLLLFVIVHRVKRLQETKKAENFHIEMFIRNYGTLAPKRFKYSEIKKMTNSFREKLGQGGYGSVYKGQLPDGQPVAVKLLTGAHGDGEDFINEVASISKTSHVNIVRLVGFCIDGKKRALMYEFMPNGSLDKFLRRDGSHLDWNTLLQIAKGIARGLEYLHRGCNTRIVHFDIKPHNILLNEDFVPKISDFGLAKLCKRKESIVSVMSVRGTAGYIAPEVFFSILGGASHKSDVYSYGMMVLEMTGARKYKNFNSMSTNESCFPDWIYKQVEVGGNLEGCQVTSEEEEKLARKMILVSLWCIQSDPGDRPSIDKVVEMLEGSIESLQIPTRRVEASSSWPFQGNLHSSTQGQVALVN